jgi:hypothetical protein
MAWLTGWDYRVEIEVQASKVDSSLTDYPVYVDLSDLPADFHDNVNADGRDIRVTQSDGSTLQAREIVYIETILDEGEIHFKASSLSSATNTVFYIYYGNAAATEPAADSTYGRENVWRTAYKGVWHLEEDAAGTGTSDLYVDSTVNHNHGDDQVSDTGKTGKLAGKGQEFDGFNDYIDCGTDSSLDFTTESFTCSFWAKTFNLSKGGTDKDSVWMYKGAFNTEGYYIQRSPPALDTSSIAMSIQEPSTQQTISDEPAFVVDEWHLFHIRKVGATVSIFRDGSEMTYFLQSTHGNITTSTDNFNLGRYAADINNFHVNGVMDEPRVIEEGLADGWISTEFNNQDDASTFYSVGAQEVKSFIPYAIII